ncbi:hypothetical protein T06_3581, partial [Trichinella sp. T6]
LHSFSQKTSNMYRPWYYKRKCPMFFDFMLPVYKSVYSIKHCLLFFSVILWLVGALTLLCVVIACSAVHCKAYAAGLSPLACLCMWVGYFLFHCAWGSHLLDQPEEEETTRSPSAKIQSSAHIPTALEIEEQEELENSPALATNDSTMVGYWKFVEEEPWQIKCSRDELR